jgi:hypothetical protein
MSEPSCLPMCSLCCTTKPPLGGFKKCGACKTRMYCGKQCQVEDWKAGGHKGLCGQIHDASSPHRPWCAYLHRNTHIGDHNLVETGKINSHPGQLVTTGMNTCIFVVIKTTTGIVGWHASIDNSQGLPTIRRTLKAIRLSDFVSGFIVPGEDREEGTLDLKPTCRTMRIMPWTDPTTSRRFIMRFLDNFEWKNKLKILPAVQSYKDFVVFDTSHEEPYAFSDVAMFNQGCSFDGAVDSHPAMMGMAGMTLL